MDAFLGRLSSQHPRISEDFFFLLLYQTPPDILSSKLISSADDINVIEGGYSYAHTLDLDTGTSHLPFRFVLRFPIDPDGAVSQWQTCPAVAIGSMLYCQRHPELIMLTRTINAYNCTYGSDADENAFLCHWGDQLGVSACQFVNGTNLTNG